MKNDFLRECMSDVGNIPIDAFNQVYCRVCAQRECVRSASNNSVFDRRVQNWKENLFDKVPRASDEDQRFDNIRAKRFLPLTPADMNIGQTPARPAYEVYSTTQLPISTIGSKPVEASAATHDPPKPTVDTSPEPAPQTPPAVAKPVEIPPNVANTPFVQGTVLKSPDSNETIIEPGGSFTFGGSDE